MSLVAYDSSDEGSENEETEEPVTITASANTNTNNNTAEKLTVRKNSKLSLPAPKIPSITKAEENEEKNVSENFKHFLDALPKPKILHSAEDVEEDSNIPSRKETESQTTKPAKRQTVKIIVPSLSDFKDVEEEIEKKPSRTIQPIERGCGLFAVLVPPKEGTIRSNKMLIPQSVKNAKANVEQTKKSSTNQTSNSKTKKVTIGKSHTELSSDEEEDVEVDFFGLTSKKDTPENTSISELLDSESSPSDLTAVDSDNSINDQPSHSSKTLTSNVMNLPKEEILLKNKADIGPKLPVPEQEYNIDTEGNVAFDEKAIEYLCGRRGVKRKNKEIDEANIIEINGEDIKPDEREWLIKALTEEPVQRPISMQSCGINSQSKKKHQITYLAHQAKAMELELKNQWSQNRMARKQTKSKYGF